MGGQLKGVGLVTDVHRHLVPPELARLLFTRPEFGVERRDGAGDGVDVVVSGRLFRLSRDFFEAERQLASMRELGIDRAVLSLATPFLAPQLDASAGRAAAEACNDGFAALIAGAESPWDAWAFLPLQDPAFCARELERRVGQGFRGGHIATSCGGAYLPDARYVPLIEAAVALDVPLFVHPADPPGRDRTGDYELTVVAGYLFESTVGIFRMVCSGFLDRWPTLKLVVPHVGGFAVTLRSRMQREVDTNPDIVLAAPVGAYLRRLWLDTICFEAGVLQAVAAIVGVDRLLLGSDAPFPLGEPDPVGFVRRSLPAGELAGVFGGNLAGLFRRDERRGEADGARPAVGGAGGDAGGGVGGARDDGVERVAPDGAAAAGGTYRGGGGGPQPHPTIGFADGQGRRVTFVQNGFVSRPMGAEVPVLYDPADPGGTAQAATFWTTWGIVLWSLPIGVGATWSFVAEGLAKVRRRREIVG